MRTHNLWSDDRMKLRPPSSTSGEHEVLLITKKHQQGLGDWSEVREGWTHPNTNEFLLKTCVWMKVLIDFPSSYSPSFESIRSAAVELHFILAFILELHPFWQLLDRLTHIHKSKKNGVKQWQFFFAPSAPLLFIDIFRPAAPEAFNKVWKTAGAHITHITASARVCVDVCVWYVFL